MSNGGDILLGLLQGISEERERKQKLQQPLLEAIFKSQLESPYERSRRQQLEQETSLLAPIYRLFGQAIPSEPTREESLGRTPSVVPGPSGGFVGGPSIETLPGYEPTKPERLLESIGFPAARAEAERPAAEARTRLETLRPLLELLGLSRARTQEQILADEIKQAMGLSVQQGTPVSVPDPLRGESTRDYIVRMRQAGIAESSMLAVIKRFQPAATLEDIRQVR